MYIFHRFGYQRSKFMAPSWALVKTLPWVTDRPLLFVFSLGGKGWDLFYKNTNIHEGSALMIEALPKAPTS